MISDISSSFLFAVLWLPDKGFPTFFIRIHARKQYQYNRYTGAKQYTILLTFAVVKSIISVEGFIG